MFTKNDKESSTLENKSQRNIAIAATFTGEPVEESLNFWGRELEIAFKIQFAPYNQVFQQLLDPSSLISNNKNGMNVILLRFDDLAQNESRTLANLDPDEKERLLANRTRYTLPNQLEIAHLNQYETEYMYKEIFVDQAYLKHGITLNDGDCIIDIGANIGLFTLFVQQKCKNPIIYGFEPSPPVFELLKINSALYGSNVQVFNFGLSSETKEAPFTFYERSSVFSTFSPNVEHDEKSIRTVIRNMLQQITTSDTGPLDEFVDELTQGRLDSKSFICQLRTLSDVIKENKIQHIDLLKIDAEKSELDILEGTGDGDWVKIKQIVMEVHDKEGELLKEIRALLEGKGFKIAVDEEHLLQHSGLYTIYATRPLGFKESAKHDSLEIQTQEKIKENVEGLVAALKSSSQRSAMPYLVCICPSSPAAAADKDKKALYGQMEDLLLSRLDGLGNVCPVKTSELTAVYPVSEYYDPHGEELGHIPYTPAFYTALGTMIARKFHSITNAPYKVVVLDCDQTLWKGICGEDGPLGIEIDPPHRELQEFMVRQHDSGMLICLCSKNNEEDVIQVFEHRPEMPLKRDHIVSWRINWRSKSENIRSLANELQLGLDSFIFVDDNPLDCAEVQANCPEVLTLRLPNKPGAIPTFLKHIWAFDHLMITEEDQKRTTLYQQNIKREQFREQSLTLADFFASLELEVKIFEAMPRHLARVSQLTQRTNQFNFTTIRRSEADFQKLSESGKTECLVVEVNDRFGDYGLVGVILFEPDFEAIKVDTFLVSCRALGRGVEHRMLARLEEIANERGLRYVEVTYIPTQKNQPALDFLDGIGSKYKDQLDGKSMFRIPTEYAEKVTYTPVFEKSMPSSGSLKEKQSYSQISEKPIAYKPSESERFCRIATDLNSAEQILRITESQHSRQRPNLTEKYMAPGNDLERSISKTWQKVLHIEKVGIHDNFFEIGGTSLKGIQLIAGLRRELNVNIPVVSLFRSPTISSMARMIRDEERQSALGEYTFQQTDDQAKKLKEGKNRLKQRLRQRQQMH